MFVFFSDFKCQMCFLCLKTKSLFWNNWKQNVTALICTVAVCLSETFTCKWNMITTEHFLYWSLTFCVESVEQYFKWICIAVTLEWQREETSKTLFYLITVTWRDAPKRIKYNYQTKFPLLGLHMACGKSKTNTKKKTQFPGTNVTYISIILSSDDFKLLGHSNGWNQCSGFGLKFSIQNLHHEKKKKRGASVHPQYHKFIITHCSVSFPAESSGRNDYRLVL